MWVFYPHYPQYPQQKVWVFIHLFNLIPLKKVLTPWKKKLTPWKKNLRASSYHFQGS